MSRSQCLSVLVLLFGVARVNAEELVPFAPSTKLIASEAKDQDDLCVWIHPEASENSLVITSDKSAGRVFTYDLEGRLVQTVSVPKPGNIDLRQRVKLDGRETDIVVVNQRTDGFRLVIFRLDSGTRQLERVDAKCETAPNYGGCLYHSQKSGRLYFFCTSENGMVEQLELTGNGQNGVDAKRVRTLMIGKCEGAVADDETGTVFVSEEAKGVWKFDADPDAPTTGTLIAKVGENGLKGDVEGLGLTKNPSGENYLLVSDQGRNRFAAYQRKTPHKYVGEFTVDGATQSDGIDVCTTKLGAAFPDGFFACHTDRSPRCILLTPWGQISRTLARQSATAF